MTVKSEHCAGFMTASVDLVGHLAADGYFGSCWPAQRLTDCRSSGLGEVQDRQH